MIKQFEVSGNGRVFGIYEADDAQGARDACAVAAGYKGEADMVATLGQPSDLVAVERSGPFEERRHDHPA
jgi:hypothetical protein